MLVIFLMLINLVFGSSQGQCSFKFISDEISHGLITSPNYPQAYPSNIYCAYEFFSNVNERLVLKVLHFDLERPDSTSFYSKNATNDTRQCFYDYLDLFSIDSDGVYHFLSRYCGNQIDSQIVTQAIHTLIVFSSDRNYESSGFKISFYFSQLNVLPFVTNEVLCGSSQINGEAGLVELSMHSKLSCAWSIDVPQHKRILIKIQQMNFTAASKLEIWENQVVNEFEANFVISKQSQSYLELKGRYISMSNRLIIKLSSHKYDSFSFVWTAAYETSDCMEFSCSGGEYCSSSNENKCVQMLKSLPFCISQSLVCNNQSNCDTGDSSDELMCAQDDQNDFTLYNIIVSFIIFMLFVPVLYICLSHYWTRWRFKRKPREMFVISQENVLTKKETLIIENNNIKKNSSFIEAIGNNSSF